MGGLWVRLGDDLMLTAYLSSYSCCLDLADLMSRVGYVASAAMAMRLLDDPSPVVEKLTRVLEHMNNTYDEVKRRLMIVNYSYEVTANKAFEELGDMTRSLHALEDFIRGVGEALREGGEIPDHREVMSALKTLLRITVYFTGFFGSRLGKGFT